MTEGVFNIVALGKQSSLATAVAASTVFPVNGGFAGFDLDRADESPDEDYGSTSREQAGRGSTGVRWATASMPFTGRFEDVQQVMASHVATISTPAGTASPYTWTFTFDESSSSLASALKVRTVEYGVSGGDQWRAVGAVIDTLDYGFDALTAPGNAMWGGTLGWVAASREYNALTGTAVAPTTLETIEGHLTSLAEGDTATAFASLSTAAATLKQFRFQSGNSAVGRPYGGTSDIVSDIGRSAKGNVTFTALVAVSATTKTDIHDIFAVAGAVPTERRWRLKTVGSGTKSQIVDFRCRFKAVDIGLQDGERLYSVSGVWVKDSTLGGRGQIAVSNGVATLA